MPSPVEVTLEVESMSIVPAPPVTARMPWVKAPGAAVLVTFTVPPRLMSIEPVALPAMTPLLVPVGPLPVAAITWMASPAPVVMVIAPLSLAALRPAEALPFTVTVVPAPRSMLAVPVPVLAKAPTPRFLEPLFGAVSLTVIAPPVPKVTETLSFVPVPTASAPKADWAPLPPSVTVMISPLPATMVALVLVPSVSA